MGPSIRWIPVIRPKGRDMVAVIDRCRRIVVLQVMIAVLFCTTACVDTSAVKRFAAVSASAGDGFEAVAEDLPRSCERRERHLALADSQTVLSRIRNQTENRCAEFAELSDRLVGANDVLVAYLKALGSLADDELVVYDGRIDDFADALDDTEMFDADKVEAVQGIAGVLSNAVAGEWRRKQLKRAIEGANPDLQSLTESLRDVIEQDYLRLLDIEIEAARHYYLGQIHTYGDREPLTVVLVLDRWRRDDEIIAEKREAAALSVKILEKISKGHQKLYDGRNDMSSKEFRSLLLEYTVILENLIEDLSALLHVF